MHILTHHAKPAKVAFTIMVPFPIMLLTFSAFIPATPFFFFVFLAPITFPVLTFFAMPKSSYAAIASFYPLFTSFTISKTAKLTCIRPKLVYIIIKNFFRKFAKKTPSWPLQTVAFLELKLQNSQFQQSVNNRKI